MATRRRKRSTRRRAHPIINPVNSTRRRRRRATRRRTVYTRHRSPVNPVRHRRRRYGRRHNPVSGSIIWLGAQYALAGLAIGAVQPTVRSFVAPYVGASPIASAGITFGTAWLLSMGARFVPFLKKYENTILVAGATIASAQVISAYAGQFIPRLGGGATMGAPRWRRGMRGIGIATGIPPHVVPPPLPPANGAGNGMQGIGMRNGAWGY